jgi:hypothetical protein
MSKTEKQNAEKPVVNKDTADKNVVTDVTAEEVVVDNPATTTETVQDKVTPAEEPEEVDFSKEGFEDSEVTLTSYPVITIAQSSTPEIQEGTEGLSLGCLMDSVARTSLGSEMEIVVYKAWKSRVLMPPREQGSFPLCYSVDGAMGSKGKECSTCPHVRFGKDNCRDQVYLLVAPVNDPKNIFRLIFWKTSATMGKKFLKIAQAEGNKRGIPLYGMTFKLTTAKKRNEAQKSTYFVFNIELANFLDKTVYLGLRPTFLVANDLRNNNVKTFYDFIEAVKNPSVDEGEVPAEDEYATGLGGTMTPEDEVPPEFKM